MGTRKVEEKKLKEKLVTSFPKIKSNDNLEVALNFEVVLIQAEISESEWVMYLRTVLTGKYINQKVVRWFGHNSWRHHMSYQKQ